MDLLFRTFPFCFSKVTVVKFSKAVGCCRRGDGSGRMKKGRVALVMSGFGWSKQSSCVDIPLGPTWWL